VVYPFSIGVCLVSPFSMFSLHIVCHVHLLYIIKGLTYLLIYIVVKFELYELYFWLELYERKMK